MKRSILLAAAGLLLTAATAQAQGLSLDQFKPPVQGGSTEITSPVTDGRDSIQAENMQDGMNYAYQALMEEGGDGIRLVTTKTGMGIIASATANYKTYQNPNATLLSKRNAYATAYADARKQLVEHMEGMTNSCETVISEGIVSIDTGVEGAATSTSESSEVCKETVAGMLAAYIVYSVADDTEEKAVTMTVASSTKTRHAVSRVGGAVIHTSDPGEAWNHVVQEVSNFATPPMGAKMIQNPANGENIVLGFGSAIIRDNPDAGIRRKLKKAADRQAQTRARSALVSFLQGDKIYWEGGFDESQVEDSQQFAIPVDQDGNPEAPQKLEETRSTFVNVFSQSDDYRVITEGRLPPGVQVKTFPSQDGNWYFALAVYMPSATAAATEAGAENRAAGGKLSDAERGGSSAAPASRTMRIEGGVSEGAPNPRGPSGQVAPRHDF